MNKVGTTVCSEAEGKVTFTFVEMSSCIPAVCPEKQ